MPLEEHTLAKLFDPGSIAVIGASHEKGKVGHTLFSNIINSEYQGEVYPVNPKGGTIEGHDVITSVDDLPGSVDLGMIVVPAKYVKDTLLQCGKKGFKHIIIISSGFAEVGDVETEEELVEIAQEYDMRILGPNVFGIYSARADLNATFGPANIKKGNIALISQSGALGIAMIGMTAEQHLGLSSIVSVGNKADINDMELIEYLSSDENTDAIMMYIEGLENGADFIEYVKDMPRDKSLVAIKAGRSEKGATAVASHTGSLAGSDKVFSAAFEQVGILRAETLTEAFNWSRVLTSSPLPKEENTVIITNGGGVGVLAADAAEDFEIRLLDDQTFLDEKFGDKIPSFGSTKNPIDITGQAGRKQYEAAMRAALEDDRVGSVVALYCETGITDPMDAAEALMEVYKEYKDRKPMVFTFIGGDFVGKCVDMLRENGVPAFTETQDALSAMGAIFKRKRALDRLDIKEKIEPPEADYPRIREIVEKIRDSGRYILLEDEGREILELAGIDMAKGAVVKTLDECVEKAEEIGYPLAMKIVSEDIVHKSDAGGIALNIEDREELIDAYQAIISNCRSKYPNARIKGVSVAEMLKGGEEVIIGGTTDPSFGPVVMFGLGGVYVEILEDVRFRVAPITKRESRRLIGDINSFPILVGARGQKRKDLKALAEMVHRVSFLMTEVDTISEIDLNPVKAFEQGKGCRSVDVRITLKREVN